ncbi:MAG: PhzF family phenazine biosynthesis protein [Gemmatimonadales bacterium]|nr:PhzF family phenazine biosynthesis protein [Gemmatimonadales bacterium]
MAIVPFHIVDAFADSPFSGNPAAIIPNAASLTEVEMLQITNELSMEAGFVLPPSTSGADLRLRFFTQRREAILSGHVAVAAMVSMVDRGFYRTTSQGVTIQLETGAGILPVVLKSGPAGAARIILRLPKPRFGEPVPAAEVGAALGLSPDILRFGDYGPQRVSCGFDQIIVPVTDRVAMRGTFRDMAATMKLLDLRGVGGVTLICPETFSHGADFHCRFFHPSVGLDEDVASGTSLGAAAAYIATSGSSPMEDEDRVSITTEQGHSLGRPNQAELVVKMQGGVVESVELDTMGVVVMRGSFHFNRKSMLADG